MIRQQVLASIAGLVSEKLSGESKFFRLSNIAELNDAVLEDISSEWSFEIPQVVRTVANELGGSFHFSWATETPHSINGNMIDFGFIDWDYRSLDASIAKMRQYSQGTDFQEYWRNFLPVTSYLDGPFSCCPGV